LEEEEEEETEEEEEEADSVEDLRFFHMHRGFTLFFLEILLSVHNPISTTSMWFLILPTSKVGHEHTCMNELVNNLYLVAIHVCVCLALLFTSSDVHAIGKL
jgi:hypothetical protein